MELDMTKGNPFKLIIAFTIPIILGNLFQQFYTIIDTIIVGRTIGVDALAAVGAMGSVVFLIQGFLQGLTTGFTIISAQRFGAGDKEGLKHSIGTAIVLSCIITAIVTLMSVFCLDWLLKVMNTPHNIYAMSKEYILIICIGMFCNVCYNLLASFLRALGNSKVPLIFLVLAAGLNIVLDLVFIINFKMGVGGAALATVISQGISGIGCLFYIIKMVPLLHIEKKHLYIEVQCAKNQLNTGIPMALQFSITAIGVIIVQSSLNLFGSVVVAAYTAALKVEQFVTQILVSIGMCMATYSAQNRGINDWERIKKGNRIASFLSATYSVAIYCIILPFVPTIIRLFVTENLSLVQEYAYTYMRICGLFFIPLGMIFIYRNILQGCGYAFLPMFGGIVELVCRCVLAFWAAKNLSFVGVCAANATAWLVTGIYLFIAYLFVMKAINKKTLHNQTE
ncbi:MAG: MATE family efflux transporter [Lachnospiraceae bacterium]